MDSNILSNLDDLFALRSEKIKMFKYTQSVGERHWPTTQPGRAKEIIERTCVEEIPVDIELTYSVS
jgi:hypothetical protein